MPERHCAYCGEPFQPTAGFHKYCSKECRTIGAAEQDDQPRRRDPTLNHNWTVERLGGPAWREGYTGPPNRRCERCEGTGWAPTADPATGQLRDDLVVRCGCRP